MRSCRGGVWYNSVGLPDTFKPSLMGDYLKPLKQSWMYQFGVTAPQSWGTNTHTERHIFLNYFRFIQRKLRLRIFAPVCCFHWKKFTGSLTSKCVYPMRFLDRTLSALLPFLCDTISLSWRSSKVSLYRIGNCFLSQVGHVRDQNEQWRRQDWWLVVELSLPYLTLLPQNGCPLFVRWRGKLYLGSKRSDYRFPCYHHVVVLPSACNSVCM